MYAIAGASVYTIFGVARYDSNIDDFIREYLTNNKDVISFNYISQLDYVVSASCKEALNSILDELSSNLKNIFDTDMLIQLC